MSAVDAPRFEAAWRTDTGRLRTLNEDAVLCFPERGLFAVIDGVGGEAGGDVGAREAAAVLLRRLSRPDESPSAHRIREAVALANNRIFDLAQRDPSLAGMSCVLTVALVEGRRLTIGHVGDTRLYRLRSLDSAVPEAQKLTRDHSPVGQMEELGELSEAEAMRHPRRNEIYRDVGSTFRRPDEEDFVEIFEEELLPGDSLLICSDGLTDQVPLREIRRIVGTHGGRPDEAIDLLIERSNAAGGKDNVSVVLVEASSDQRAEQPLQAAGTTVTRDEVARTRGAAAVRGGSRRKIVAAALALTALTVLAFAFWQGPERLQQSFASASASVRALWPFGASGDLIVGEGSYASIQEALDAAREGQRIVIGPGVYEERLRLRAGVAIEVLPPRSATLRVPAGDVEGASVGVEAVSVDGASVRGLRIEPATAGALTVGFRLADSEVLLQDVLVVGAADVALDVLGTDRSVIELSTLRSERSRIVRLAGNGATQLRQNIFERSGEGNGLPAMIEVEGLAAPVFLDNKLLGSGTAALVGSAERAQEFELRNELPDEKLTVRVRSAAVSSAEGEPP
ncbi:MAG: protein phosphatase 2C domain-containing protein [Acidobacteriota bacterium]